VLYRLPDVLREIQEGVAVVIVEGEKDVETLIAMEYSATCNSGGAGKWCGRDAEGYAQSLAGADVIVIPDRDKPGKDHAADIVRSLLGRTTSVHVLELPAEIDGQSIKDVSDFFDAGGTREQFEAAWDAAPTADEWMASNGFVTARGDIHRAADGVQGIGDESQNRRERRDIRPPLDASDLDLSRITGKTWKVIKAANASDPELFRHGGVLSRVESGDDGRPFLRVMGHHHLRGYLAEIALWGTLNSETQEWHDAYPPMPVVMDVLTTPEPPLPVLDRIVESPVYASDGTLPDAPGYHSAGKILYVPVPGFSLPEISANPTLEEVREAVRILQIELLGDFPFVGDPDRAHVIAGMILPFARALIDGPTPLHLVEKPSPGTGATKLVNVMTLPFLGCPVSTLTEGSDEDEWRKRVTALLVGGPSVILIDNLRRKLDSAALSAALTSPMWEDRLLGLSVTARLKVNCLWLATGNNPAVSNEIARRTVRIRLDAKQDRPWLREGFRHPDLEGYVMANRGLIVWACLVLVQAWLAAGKPLRKKTLGMFENWGHVIGGILDVAGIPGFLGNLEEFYERADVEGAQWRTFVSTWWEEHQDAEIGVAELFDKADDIFDLGAGNDKSRKTRMGKMLGSVEGRVFDNLRIERGSKKQRATLWRLHRTSNEAPCDPGVNVDSDVHSDVHQRNDLREQEEVNIENMVNDSPSPDMRAHADKGAPGMGDSVSVHTRGGTGNVHNVHQDSPKTTDSRDNEPVNVINERSSDVQPRSPSNWDELASDEKGFSAYEVLSRLPECPSCHGRIHSRIDAVPLPSGRLLCDRCFDQFVTKFILKYGAEPNDEVIDKFLLEVDNSVKAA
jgi:5S rRNA maturation endonuclease (ribonuclease M5)